jgi:NTP pyrophosphatase (non-canonical NTP hydrolase)
MDSDLKEILKFRDNRDWKQFHSAKNLAISLSLETSEILELFQWSENNNLPKEKLNHLKDEIADIYYYLLLLAYETNIDIKKAFLDKMKKNNEKYPVEKAKGKSKKYTEL